jgi:uncharacterized protein YneF (UPF0154 family)
MDQERMMLLLGLAAWFVAGIALGVVYFVGIWWSARQFADGGRVTTTIALSLLRLAVLGGLLAMALGVVLGRFGVMRRLREATP